MTHLPSHNELKQQIKAELIAVGYIDTDSDWLGKIGHNEIFQVVLHGNFVSFKNKKLTSDGSSEWVKTDYMLGEFLRKQPYKR